MGFYYRYGAVVLTSVVWVNVVGTGVKALVWNCLWVAGRRVASLVVVVMVGGLILCWIIVLQVWVNYGSGV